MKIRFIGAAREVTGSKHLITTKQGKKILLDCGMFQGKGLETDAMNRKLGFNPEEIDHIILSHAHIDHSGLIPYMYKLGFRGSIICTNATRDLCAIMLVDCGHIQAGDVKNFNKRRVAKGLPPIEPLYSEEEARACMQLFIAVGNNRRFNIDNDISVRFTNTGHMLGSSVVTLEVNEYGKRIRLAYTGDIGRPESRILKSPEPFPQCDYLITETTYGNRLHPKMQDAEKELLRVIIETCVEKRGKLIIPSFAIGRTQEVIYSLNNFFNEGKLPKVNIYLDSPLAINATEIFKMHAEELNKNVAKVMLYDPDPFGFNSLFYIKSAEESKSLNSYKQPCVIISASGMMEAGRIKHHIANNIENPKNTILAVGYCSPTTLGARILGGADEVSIFGVRHPVKADIERIEAFSGHGDYQEMANFISCQDASKVKKVFLVHGEYESATFYADYIRKRGFDNIEIPESGKEFVLN
ncbi:MAG TPA: MBL fold metallo-hydrolase [Prolixibacteraceae bacterium]|nr:MBL fold metallo-hydrolase [Prolixibacteraceae bacterium]HPR84873.1 MBL fold metallo-hydrolase [Prolixibacteraceae bacterium]